MVTLTKYLFTTSLGDREILFNTATSAIIVVNKEVLCLAREYPSRLASDAREKLENAGFLVDESVDETTVFFRSGVARRSEARKYFKIIIETGLDCNLSCPYCYEDAYRKARPFGGPEIIYARFLELAEKQRELEHMRVAVIGGEPLLGPSVARELIARIRSWGRWASVRVSLGVDTNGSLMSDTAVDPIDDLYVALSEPGDQDAMRPYKSGRGSLSNIWHRLRQLAPMMNKLGADVTFRYKVHSGNTGSFQSFLERLQLLGLRQYYVEVSPILNWAGNPVFGSVAKEAIEGMQLCAYKNAVAAGRRVRGFPKPTPLSCGGYEGRIVKILSDGKLAMCDADTLADDDSLAHRRTVPLRSLQVPVYLAEAEAAGCRDCFFRPICGGRHFCKEGDLSGYLDQCDFRPYDLGDYLRWFVEQYPKTPELFDVRSR